MSLLSHMTVCKFERSKFFEHTNISSNKTNSIKIKALWQASLLGHSSQALQDFNWQGLKIVLGKSIDILCLSGNKVD